MTKKPDKTPAEVRDVPLAELKPAAWNPRTITDKRFASLCKSIKADPDFLRLRPVLAQANGVIYAGNMRYRAAQHLGLETIPAIITEVPEKLAKERAMKDNNGWGEWQHEQVTELLEGLKGLGSDVADLGFTDKEITGMLDDATAGLGGGEGGGLDTTFEVVVECDSEEHQGEVHEALTDEGYTCRMQTS